MPSRPAPSATHMIESMATTRRQAPRRAAAGRSDSGSNRSREVAATAAIAAGRMSHTPSVLSVRWASAPTGRNPAARNARTLAAFAGAI